MEKILFTVFESSTKSKTPTSPFDDKTFIFNSIEVPMDEVPFLIENFYYLNRGFNIKNKRLKRTRETLEKHLVEPIQFIVLDVDKVYNIAARDKVILTLTEENIPFVLCKSRSYDENTNFNMKGVFFVEGHNNTNGILEFLYKIQRKIGNVAEIDLSVSRIGALQAPTLQENSLIFQTLDNPKPYIRYIEKQEFQTIHQDNEITQIAIEQLNLLGFSIADEKDDMFIFQHPNEKTPKGYFLFKDYPFILRHFNPKKNISLFKELIKHKKVKKYFEEIDTQRKIEIIDKPYIGNKITVKEKFLKVDGKKNFIKSFLKDENGVLHIKSPMGSGKSNIIDYILENTDKRVLFITNRISIAKDIMEKYDGLKLYSTTEWNIGDNLVCQFDSLWKYDLKDFDLVIIDEFMSLLLHTRNSLNNFNVLNKIKFFYSLNKQLVLLDAFLFNYEDKFLGSRNRYIIENSYRDRTSLVEYEDINNLLSKIVKVSEKETKTITISCNTKTLVNSIKLMLETRGKKVIVIDSGTSDDEKEIIYSTFKDGSDSYDVLIYSPSLTVGISMEFESNWHFHIDEGNSIDVISSLQMMKRNRNAKNIHFYIKEKKKYLQYEDSVLLAEFERDLETKFFNQKETGFLIDVDMNGNFTPSRFAKFQIKIEALYNLLSNNNYTSFKKLLEFQFLNEPKMNEKFVESFIGKYKKEYKENEKRMIEILTTKFKKGMDNDKKISDIERNFLSLQDDEIEFLLNESVKTPDIIKKIYNFKIYNENKIKNIVSKLSNENIIPANEKANFRFMLLLKEKGFSLKPRFVINELRDMGLPVDKMKTFLYSIGYKWRYNSFIFDPVLNTLSSKLLL